MERAREPLNVYNLGCDDWLQVTGIADMVVKAMGLQDVSYEFTGGEGGWPGDVPHFRYDISRLQALGWQPSRHSTDAVRHAVKQIIANGF